MPRLKNLLPGLLCLALFTGCGNPAHVTSEPAAALAELTALPPTSTGTAPSPVDASPPQRITLAKLVPITAENTAEIVELRRFEIPGFDQTVEGQCSVAFAPDDIALAAACNSTQIPIWDLQTGELSLALGDTGIIWKSVDISDAGQVAAGGYHRTIYLWDLTTGEKLFSLQGDMATVREVAFSPDGAFLATISQHGHLLIWDTDSGKLTVDMKGHPIRNNSVNFDPTGEWVISGGGDNQAYQWDLESGEIVQSYSGARFYIEDVDISPDGATIA